MLLSRTSLQAWLITAMCLVAVIPALTLSYLLADRGAEQRTERSAERMVRLGSFLGRSVDGFITEHRRAVNQLAHSVARSVESGDTDRLPRLLAFHNQYSNFLATIATNAEADLLSATIHEGPGAQEWVIPADNVSDREYFQMAKGTGRPFVSDVFVSRGLDEQALIVAISAPVLLSDSRFAGIVEASLMLSEFERLFAAEELPEGLEVVLVDQRNRMIQQSDGLLFGPLSEITNETWARTSVYGLDKQGYITASAPAGHDWRILMRLPRDRIATQRWGEFRFALGVAAIALLLTIAIAVALATFISRPLAWLDDKIRKLDPQQEVPNPPQMAPLEIRRIASHLQEVSTRLRNSYTDLHEAVGRGEALQETLTHTVREREIEIAERTDALVAANARLEALSRIDSLTGVLNRRALDEVLEKTVDSAVRDFTPLSVMLIDVDYFKRFNDCYGHVDGDKCLRRIAKTLSGVCARPLDRVARYGGEEFMVVLPQTPHGGAGEVAERARVAIAELGITHADAPEGSVTVSIGFATADPCTKQHGEILIEAADQALYRAKDEGRNRAVGCTLETDRSPGVIG